MNVTAGEGLKNRSACRSNRGFTICVVNNVRSINIPRSLRPTLRISDRQLRCLRSRFHFREFVTKFRSRYNLPNSIDMFPHKNSRIEIVLKRDYGVIRSQVLAKQSEKKFHVAACILIRW